MKTIRSYDKKSGLKACGFSLPWMNYGKNAHGKYRLEIDLGIPIAIYHGDKKPIIRDLYVLSILFAWVPLIYYPLLYIVYGTFRYFSEMAEVLIDNNRMRYPFFTIINFIALIIFIGLFIWKC
jgi:hypothetical protein